MLTALLAFAAASVLIVLIPGPDTLVVLRAIVVHGKRSAALTTIGVLTGIAVWICAAAFGLTALLRASHDGYLALRIVGAAYLIVIGIQALRARAVGNPTTSGASPVPSPRRAIVGKGFRAGLATDLLNPKVGVFFITFLPAFIPHGEPVAAATFALGSIFLIEGALYFVAILTFVERLTNWLENERVRRRLNRATGVILVGFGIRLAAEG